MTETQVLIYVFAFVKGLVCFSYPTKANLSLSPSFSLTGLHRGGCLQLHDLCPQGYPSGREVSVRGIRSGQKIPGMGGGGEDRDMLLTPRSAVD